MARQIRIAIVMSVAFAAALAAPASAAEHPSGTAEKVSQSAQATGNAGERELETRASVFMGDHIRTNRAGEAQIRLLDNTRVVIGPSASLTIDAFVFNGQTAETVTLSAVRGAFRFITGNSRKHAYLLRTPVMTIGVRGTGIDGFVQPGTGETTIAIYEGAAELCDSTGQCRLYEGTCGVRFPPGGGFQEPQPASRALLFPYAGSQASLLADFRLDTSACRSASLPSNSPEATEPGAGTPSGGGDSKNR